MAYIKKSERRKAEGLVPEKCSLQEHPYPEAFIWSHVVQAAFNKGDHEMWQMAMCRMREALCRAEPRENWPEKFGWPEDYDPWAKPPISEWLM